jgi:hypothetical protein
LLGHSFGSLIFLSRSHVTSGKSVKLTCFFSQFFMILFFLISSFCIKLFTLELCHFFASLSVLLFREQVGKANLDWLRGFWHFFNLGFFYYVILLKLFFYLDLILRVIGSSNYFKLTRVFFFKVVCFEVFFFIYNTSLLDFELYTFFLLLFYTLFWFYILDRVLVNLTWIVWRIITWISFWSFYGTARDTCLIL